MDFRRFSFIVLDALESAIKIENILKPLNAQTKHCTSLGEFRSYIEQLSMGHNRIILITSGTFALQLRQDFQNDRYPQISSIYVFCTNKLAHQRWTSAIPKVNPMISIERIE